MYTKRKIPFPIQMLWWDIALYRQISISQPFCKNGDSSDDEGLPLRSAKQRPEPSSKEELDASSLIAAEEATKKFERAEKRRRVYLFSSSYCVDDPF